MRKKFKLILTLIILFFPTLSLKIQIPYPHLTRRILSPHIPQTSTWEEFLTMVLKEVFPSSDREIPLERSLIRGSFADVRHFGLTPSRPWLEEMVRHVWYRLYKTFPSKEEITTLSLEIYNKLRKYEFLDFINIKQPEVTCKLRELSDQTVQEIDPEWIELEQALLDDQKKDPSNLEIYRTLEQFYRELIQKYPQRLYYYWQLSWVYSALGEHQMRRAIFLEGAKQEMHPLPLYIRKIDLAEALLHRENALITWGRYEETDSDYLKNHARKYYLHFPEIFIPQGNPISSAESASFRNAAFTYGTRAKEIIQAKDTEFYAFYRDGVVNFLAYRPDTLEVVGFRMRKVAEGRWQIAIDTFYKASPGMIEDLFNNHLIDSLIDRNGNFPPYDGYPDEYRIYRLPEQINEFTYFGLDYDMYAPAFQVVKENIIEPLKETSNRVGVIMIAGVSAAGKTPGAELIRSLLVKEGINAKILSMDNYFINRDLVPMRNGARDYDNPVALDIRRFKSDLSKLLRGKEVELPRYDFESGKSIPHSGVKMSLNPGEVLIIEGIHALNPELTGGIKSFLGGREIYSVRIFVDAPPDLRLPRRMIRDWQTRGHSPYDTLKQWENVRYGEDTYIYPTIQHADVVIDTTISEERFRSLPLYFELREALQTALSEAEIMEDISLIERIKDLQEKYFGSANAPRPGP